MAEREGGGPAPAEDGGRTLKTNGLERPSDDHSNTGAGDAQLGTSGAVDVIAGVFAPVVNNRTWLAWNWEGSARRKRPLGKANDPQTWKTLAEARAAEKQLGLVLTDRELCGGIVCVDLDGCRDPESGKLSDWAVSIIERLGSYTEVSPSGTGVKMFLLAGEGEFGDGTVPISADAVSSKKPQIELFAGGGARFVTVTGDNLDGTPLTLTTVDAETWAELVPEDEQDDERSGRHDDDPLKLEAEKVRDALRFVAADDRFDWLRVTAALWNAVQDQELHDSDARRIWEDWSRTSPEKFNEQANAETWEKLRQRGPKRRKATLWTIYERLAKPNGWPGYVVGRVGPVPLGRLRDGNFAVLDQNAHIVRSMSAEKLVSTANLMGLAPPAFWKRQFPVENKNGLFNAYGAGATIMEACNQRGAFNPTRTRGRGVWREGSEVVVNLDGNEPESADYLYLCFEPLALVQDSEIDPKRVFEWIKRFNWKDPSSATLYFGWMAFAPVCGVVDWRPHVFLHGPWGTGKTTLMTTTTRLLTPLVVSADGASTEAGIRQSLGPDSLPVVIDEFESDHDQRRLQSVIKLARSASSADSPVLRGTPEGKAMQFALRTTFLLAAINPIAGSAADETRLIALELEKHNGDREMAQVIDAGKREFAALGPAWCSLAVRNAKFLPDAIEIIKAAMSGRDERHRNNMGTLLAAAFVMLEGRVPTKQEASAWVEQHAETLETHGEAHRRDDAVEALDFLLSQEERIPVTTDEGDRDRTIYETKTLRQLIVEAYEHGPYEQGSANVFDGADIRVLRGWEGKSRGTGEVTEPGDYLSLRVGSTKLRELFARSKWSNWALALGKLEGAHKPYSPLRFGSRVGKQRAVLVPLHHWWQGEGDEERAPEPEAKPPKPEPAEDERY